MDIGIFEWLIAIIASILLGISKAGLKGISIIIVVLLALVFGSKASTGIIVPLLIAGDILAVFYYRRHADKKLLFQFLPWMIAGIVLAGILGGNFNEVIFKYIMAAIVLVSVIILLLWEILGIKRVPTHWSFAGMAGTTAGFTTMIGNLAGPFANIYFLAKQSPKKQFIGTTAWLFLIVNIIKLPIHIFSWKTIDLQTFLIDLRLFPAIILGFLVGVKIVSLFKEHSFRYFIYAVTILGAIMIFIK